MPASITCKLQTITVEPANLEVEPPYAVRIHSASHEEECPHTPLQTHPHTLAHHK